MRIYNLRDHPYKHTLWDRLLEIRLVRAIYNWL